MAYIFLDESGDLGFDLTKRGTSKFFVITFLCCVKKGPIEKVIAQCHSELKKKHKITGGVLHCFREKPVTRQRLLKRLVEKECSVMAIYLDKKRVYTKLKDEKDVLYNMVTNILLDRIMSKKLLGERPDEITLIASRKETNAFLNEQFKEYLRQKMMGNHHVDIQVDIRTPHEEKGLQAVDFISWSIFRKLESNDATYCNIIQSKIVEENPLYS